MELVASLIGGLRSSSLTHAEFSKNRPHSVGVGDGSAHRLVGISRGRLCVRQGGCLVFFMLLLPSRNGRREKALLLPGEGP
jgi:hypothetical protein